MAMAANIGQTVDHIDAAVARIPMVTTSVQIIILYIVTAKIVLLINILLNF